MDERATIDCVANARALAPVIAAAAPRIEAERELPADLVDALHEARLFRMLVPRSLGGDEVSPVAFVQAIEEIAKADASTAWCIAQTSVCSTIAKSLKLEIAEEIFKNDPRGVLAWGPHGDERQGDRGTRAAIASPAPGRSPAAAGTPPGLPRIARSTRRTASCAATPSGKPVQKTFVVPRETRGHQRRLACDRAQGHRQRHLCVDRRVRAGGSRHRLSRARSRRAARARPALLVHHLPAVRLEPFRRSRSASRAPCSMLSCELAQNKKPAGGRRRCCATTRWCNRRSASLQSQLAAARVFFFQAWEEIWQAAQAGALTLDQRVRLRMASIHASQQARQVVETTYLAAGATAVFVDQSVRAPVPRHACGVAAGAVAILDLRGHRPAFSRPAAAFAADLMRAPS